MPSKTPLAKLADKLQDRVDKMREAAHTDREDAMCGTLEIIIEAIKEIK